MTSKDFLTASLLPSSNPRFASCHQDTSDSNPSDQLLKNSFYTIRHYGAGLPHDSFRDHLHKTLLRKHPE
jgi:hypothetical protein